MNRLIEEYGTWGLTMSFSSGADSVQIMNDNMNHLIYVSINICQVFQYEYCLMIVLYPLDDSELGMLKHSK